MKKTVSIGGNDLTLRCSALVPRLYRRACNRDLVRDMNELRTSYNRSLKIQKELAKREDVTEEELSAAQLSALDLEIFENLAWAFCKDADRENIPDTPDEWLDGIDGMFSIYEIFPVIVELWNDSNTVTSIPAKK